MTPSRQAVPPFVHLAAHPLRWQLLNELAGSDYRVRELVTSVGEPQNLISYHLRLLREAGLVRTTRSSHDGRDSYYHLDLDHCAETLIGAGTELHPALRLRTAPPVFDPATPLSVLFVCSGNSARSVIAEALLRHHSGDRVQAFSAGSRPKPAMHPHTVRALREQFGIDISTRTPRHLDTLTGHRFDTVITLCDKAREVCPEFGPAPRRSHWSIPDPPATHGTNEDTYPAFTATATEIHTRVRHLLPTLTAAPTRRNQR